jgi:hypothetical protein
MAPWPGTLTHPRSRKSAQALGPESDDEAVQLAARLAWPVTALNNTIQSRSLSGNRGARYAANGRTTTRSPFLLQHSTGRILAIAITAASVAAMTAYAASSVTADVGQPSAIGPAETIAIKTAPQMVNRAAKSDRVALLLDSSSYTDFSPSLLAPAIASVTVAFDHGTDPSGSSSGLLNDAQIAGIGSRLRLTAQQAEYWPAVAVALRDISRRYFPSRHQHPKGVGKIDVNSAEVQRLIEAAAPLIHLLREDQKREVRQLVRIIGLESVASRI